MVRLGDAARIPNPIAAAYTEASIAELAEGIAGIGDELVTALGPELSFGACRIKASESQNGRIFKALPTHYGIACRAIE